MPNLLKVDEDFEGIDLINPSSDLKHVINRNDVVIPKKSVTVQYDYYNEDVQVFFKIKEYSGDNMNFTVKKLVNLISRRYKRIHKVLSSSKYKANKSYLDHISLMNLNYNVKNNLVTLEIKDAWDE